MSECFIVFPELKWDVLNQLLPVLIKLLVKINLIICAFVHFNYSILREKFEPEPGLKNHIYSKANLVRLLVN